MKFIIKRTAAISLCVLLITTAIGCGSGQTETASSGNGETGTQTDSGTEELSGGNSTSEEEKSGADSEEEEEEKTDADSGEENSSTNNTEEEKNSAEVPTLNGIPLTDFTIVAVGDSKFNTMALDMKKQISKLYGVDLERTAVSKEERSVDAASHTITIGEFDSSKTYGINDAEVFWKDGSVFIGAGGVDALKMAESWLLYEAFESGSAKAVTLPEGGTAWTLTWPEREEYINDPTVMPLFWQYLWEPKDYMLPWENKVAALYGEDQEHLFTIAHRAEQVYYPENSVEAVISAWAAGADCVDLDIRLTKDGIPVLMHDSSLERMTNVEEFAGKDGFPVSYEVSDWTYEELTTLNLTRMDNWCGTVVTPFKIATLKEVLTVCKGRVFIKLEFKDKRIGYSDLQGKEYTLLPIMLETGNASSVLLGEGTGNVDDTLALQKQISEATGEDMYLHCLFWQDLTDETTVTKVTEDIEKLRQNTLTNVAVAIANGEEYSKLWKGKKSQIKELHDQYPDLLFGICNWSSADTDALFQEAYDLGARSIWAGWNLFTLLEFEAGLAPE